MGTTTAKKEILDYLWEWAEKTGYWAKLLVKTVVENEASLSEEERKAVYNAFLQPILSAEKKALEPIKRPHYFSWHLKKSLILKIEAALLLKT